MVAQSIFASIVGTVTDASSAVVPKAKVTATNVNTNEKREFLTNEFGSYEINNLSFPVFTQSKSRRQVLENCSRKTFNSAPRILPPRVFAKGTASRR